MFRSNPIIAKAALAAAVFAGHSFSAYAVSPFVVKDLRVEGLQRVEPGTVFAYVPLKQGDTFTDAKGSEIIRALYATGFFNDVRVSVQSGVVIIEVQERAAIASVDFAGIKAFNKDNLNKALRAVELFPGRYYDKSLVDKAEQELKRQYLTKGLYAAEVKTTITPIGRNRVTVLFTVIEGPTAKIKQVNFLGNKAVKSSVLQDEMQISAPNWFSWYTKNDLYSKERLTGDLERIRSYYLDRGYLEFNIESTQVSISPDKQDIYLTVKLHEGEPYTVSNIQLAGELLNKQTELQSLITLKPGERFSASKLQASSKAISDKLGGYGYAFANVNSQPTLDAKNHTVVLTMQVNPGRRAYVRRINISGHERTRDEVIRREMRQFESSWFDAQRLKLSQDRLNRLDYFTDVSVTPTPVAGTTDQVDVDVKVAEKSTGSFMLGAGFSSTDKVLLTASFSQDNVFGSGTSLGVQVNTAKAYRTLMVNQIDPYFTVDGIKRITNVYYRTYQPLLYSSSNTFSIRSAGADLKFGVPFSESDTVYFGVGIEQERFQMDKDTPDVYKRYIAEFGNVVRNVPLSVGWSRDYRDSALVPSEGYFTYTNVELGTPAGKTQYYRLDLKQEYYYSFARGLVLGLNAEIGYGKGLANKSYPIFKNYFAGGIGSIRGYQPSSLGPRDPKTTDPIGGSKKIVANVELTFPLPNTGYDRTLRVFTFLDAGNVWAQDEKINLAQLRYGYGAGLVWLSPIGALKLSLGFPLVKKKGDLYQKFQFQIGTSF